MKKLIWFIIFFGSIFLSLSIFVFTLSQFMRFFIYSCSSILFQSFAGCIRVYAFSFILGGFYISHIMLSDRLAEKFSYDINIYICLSISFGIIIMSLWLFFKYSEVFLPFLVLLICFISLFSIIFFNNRIFSLSKRRSIAFLGLSILFIFLFFLNPLLVFEKISLLDIKFKYSSQIT